MNIKQNKKLYSEELFEQGRAIEWEENESQRFLKRINIHLQCVLTGQRINDHVMDHKQNELIHELTTQPKVTVLMFFLRKCQKRIGQMQVELNKQKGIRSKEIQPKQIKKELIDQLENAIKDLTSNNFEQNLFKQRDALILKNFQLQLQIKALKNHQKALQLTCTQKSSDILFKLNDYINQRIDQRQKDSVIQMQQKSKTQQQEEIIEQLKRQLELQIKTGEYLKKQHEDAQRQVGNLKKNIKQLKFKLKQLQDNIITKQTQLKTYLMNEAASKEKYLISFINQGIKDDLFLENNIKNKEQIINHCKYLHRSLLVSSEILINSFQIRYFLSQSIENHIKYTIKRTKVLYSYDESHKSFGSYLIDNHLPFLIILKLQNGRICGGFCPGLKQELPCFLFTFFKNGKIYLRNEKSKTINGCIYADSSLVFGSNQFVMSNGKKQVRLNFASFGQKYFQNVRMSDFVDADSNNITKFEEMEIHGVYF